MTRLINENGHIKKDSFPYIFIYLFCWKSFYLKYLCIYLFLFITKNKKNIWLMERLFVQWNAIRERFFFNASNHITMYLFFHLNLKQLITGHLFLFSPPNIAFYFCSLCLFLVLYSPFFLPDCMTFSAIFKWHISDMGLDKCLL